MLCRTCGNPVKIRGDRWECPYCYDYGHIKLPEVQITVTYELSCRIKMPDRWNSLKTALAELKPDGTLEPLLSKVVLHEISAALRQLNAPPSAKKLQELEAFLNSTPDLHLEDSVGAIMKRIRSEVIYTQVAELTQQSLGSFWAQLLAALPPEQYYDGIPEPLVDLQRELAHVWAYFSSADGKDIGEPLDRKYELENAFQLHWQEKALLHPDVERAKGLLSRGEFPANEDICRNILVAEYPEEAAFYSLEELDAKRWYYLLDDVFERDAVKAIQMWRALMDVAAPCLATDPVVAEKLLHDWDVLESASFYTAEAFFSALADETFAKQIFDSAYVGHLQRQLLELCCKLDRLELGQHCLGLALKNPYTSESWERRLKQALSPAPKHTKAQKSKPSAVSPPDDGMVFHYCTVHISGVRRPYAYLTGNLPLKVGDWVEVPFGKDDIPRRGQIGSLTVCTRTTAPWPPEQTKTVLRVVEAPVEVAKTSEQAIRPASVSKPKPTPEPAQKKSEPKAAPEPVATPEPIPVTAPKRRFPWKLACGGIAIFACIIAGAFSYRSNISHYQQAEQYLADNDFQNAAVELSHVPSFYRDQETLARYAELCLLAESGTEAACKTALDGLEILLSSSDEALRTQIQPQYERIHKQYNDLLYDTALDCLRNARFKQALDYLRQVPLEYPDTAALLRYAQAGANAKSSDSSYHLQTVLAAMEKLPADYSGAFAAEMAAFKVQLSDMIAAAEANEEVRRAEREAARDAAQKAEEERLAVLAAIGPPYIGMAERDVNATRQLGKAYRSDTENGQQVYSWYSKANGDLVFQAKCSGDQVVSTVKHGGDAYWNGDQLLVKLGPQIIHRFNSGGASNNSHDYSVRDDYDNPEDFYEDNRDWFDDEDEAWDYWYED